MPTQKEQTKVFTNTQVRSTSPEPDTEYDMDRTGCHPMDIDLMEKNQQKAKASVSCVVKVKSRAGKLSMMVKYDDENLEIKDEKVAKGKEETNE